MNWTRECKPTTRIQQVMYFTNMKPNREFFAILHEGQIVGTTGLTEISQEHKTAEFSLLIGSEFQRKGFGMKALKELLIYGFDHLKLNLIFGETFSYREKYGVNPGAKAYEKLGFKLDGTLRSRYIKHGITVDSLVYSITKEEIL